MIHVADNAAGGQDFRCCPHRSRQEARLASAATRVRDEGSSRRRYRRARATPCAARAVAAQARSWRRSVRPGQLSASAADTFAHGLSRLVPQEHQGERRQQAEGRKRDQSSRRSHTGHDANDSCQEYPHDSDRPFHLFESHNPHATVNEDGVLSRSAHRALARRHKPVCTTFR